MLNPWLNLPAQPPFVLPGDGGSLTALSRKIAAVGSNDCAINLDSLPEPFIGNPETATVLLLNLNPGDDPDDARAHADPAFREALIRNLRHGAQEYPFYPLNPALRWTACGTWWTKHVRELLEHRLLDRLRVAQRLCVVEWFPYHSKRGRMLPDNLVCQSQQYCFEIVRKAIGSKLIVGMRSRQKWAYVDARLASVPYLRNFQAPYISVGNTGHPLFGQIVEALR